MKISKFFWVLPLLTSLGCGKVAVPPAPPTCPKVEAVKPEEDKPEILWRDFNGFTLTESKVDHKLILITFMSKDCNPCRVMKKTTFKDPRVIKLINENFVPVLLEGEEYLGLMDKLGLDRYWPTTAVLGPNGGLIASASGYIAPNSYVASLNKLLQAVKDDEANRIELEEKKSMTSLQ